VADIDRQIRGQTAATLAEGKRLGTVDRAVAELAGQQHGVVARRQLLAFGLGPGAIEHRIANGRLHRVHYGVYAVGYRSLTPHGRWLAAVLAAGPGAVLSHRSAAALWGLRPAAGRRIDVTVRRRGRRDRPGIAVHVTRELRDRDRAQRVSIPVTSVARTLLDLAGVIPERQLSRAFEEADRADLLDLDAIEDICLRGRGRRGLGARFGSSPTRPVRLPPPARSSSGSSLTSATIIACLGPGSTLLSRASRSTRFGRASV